MGNRTVLDPTTQGPHQKTASGVVVYLLEELGDARLRCAQLKRYIKQATDLIDGSDERDRFFETAGHLINGIPELVLKMDQALDAASLAAARLDYEEIKNGLRPEKVEELESVLQDARMRYLKRRSNEKGTPMNGKTAANILDKLATITASTGRVPVRALSVLIAKLEKQDKRAQALTPKAGKAFVALAAELRAQMSRGENPSRAKLASVLRNILADTMPMQPLALDPMAGAGEDFQKANPAISDEEAEVIDEMHEKHEDKLKSGE